MRKCRLSTFILFLLGLIPGGNLLGQAKPIHIPAGETARAIVVAIANDVVIDGRAEQGVFTAGSTLTIAGRVQGDVAVIGGKLILRDGAEIDGNVLVVGSTQDISTRAVLNGKLFVMPFLGKEIHQMFSDPASYLFSYQYDFQFIASRLFFALFWFIAALVVFKFFPAHVAFACQRLKHDPGYMAGMGVVGTAGLVVLGLFSLALCLLLIGIPIFIGLLIFIFAGWVFGQVILFYITGELLLKLFRIRTSAPMIALVVAIVVWTAIKFLPGLSLLVHLIAFCLSLGITLTTRFGTGTPWFRRGARLSAPVTSE